MIKGKLSWYNLQQCHRLFIILLFSSGCVLCSLTCDYEVMHGTSVWGKNRLWHSTGEFSPFIFADLWQLKKLWLIWSVPLTAMTHSSFPVSGCHLSLLVKRPDKTKASTAACEHWNKTSRFYSSALSLHYNHFLKKNFLRVCGCESGTGKCSRTYIHSGVKICLAKSLHINLFGRNDKNQSVRTAASAGYDCQVHTDPAVKPKHLLQLISVKLISLNVLSCSQFLQ